MTPRAFSSHLGCMSQRPWVGLGVLAHLSGDLEPFAGTPMCSPERSWPDPPLSEGHHRFCSYRWCRSHCGGEGTGQGQFPRSLHPRRTGPEAEPAAAGQPAGGARYTPASGWAQGPGGPEGCPACLCRGAHTRRCRHRQQGQAAPLRHGARRTGARTRGFVGPVEVVEQTRDLVTSAWPEWGGVWEAQVRGGSHVHVGGIAPSTTGQTTPIRGQGIYRWGRQQNSACGSPRPARQKPGALKADVRPTLQARGWGSSLLPVPAEGSRPTKTWTKYQPKAAVKCPSCHPKSKQQSWGGPTPSSSGSD